MKFKKIISTFVFLFSISTIAQTTPPVDPSKPATTPANDVQGAITSDKEPVADPTLPTTPAESESTSSQEFPRSQWGVYGGFGAPHGINFGLEYIHHSRYWSLGVDGGTLDAKLRDEADDKEEINSSSFGFEGRYHPGQAAFYIGAGLGTQKIVAKKTATYSGSSVTPQIDLENTYLTPKVGWLWQFNSGLNLGFELGAQVPLSSKVDINDGTTNPVVINDPEFIKHKSEIQDTVEKIGKQVFPHLVLRIGYAF